MKKLGELFASAAARCDQGASTADFEDSFAEVLDYIKQHPELRDRAEALLLDALSASPTPWELIGFCMHELRWQTVRDRAEALRAAAADPRCERVYRLILEAFTDDWDQRAMYSYPFTRPRKNPVSPASHA